MRIIYLVIGLGLVVGSAFADCVPPLDSEEPMLSYVKELAEERSLTLEIFAGGRSRIVFPEGAEATWIDSSGLEGILLSIRPILPHAALQALEPSNSPDGRIRLAVIYCDVEAGETRRFTLDVASSSDLNQEMQALQWWLWKRLEEEANQPFWTHANPRPAICQPDYRREGGLGIEEPFWCKGRVGPTFRFDPELHSTTLDEIRERLRERLKNLPRGRQDSDD